MVRMYVRHPVSNFANWKQAYDDFDAERRGMGVVGDAVFQSTADPNDVTVWHDFESEQSARAFLDSPRLKEVMESAGVAEDPSIWLTTQA